MACDPERMAEIERGLRERTAGMEGVRYFNVLLHEFTRQALELIIAAGLMDLNDERKQSREADAAFRDCLQRASAGVAP